MAFTASRVPAVMRPPQRRHRTGRNAQLNFKVTPETLAQFTAIRTDLARPANAS
jgi:hypothetical protein